MAPLLLYLLETGICLSLFYLAWWLFLRKETYFGFNRLYLVGSMVLALLVPVLHVSLEIPVGSALERPAREISQFRDGYEDLIAMLDADFGREPGPEHALNGREGISAVDEEWGILPREGSHGIRTEAGYSEDSESRGGKDRFPGWSKQLFALYILGVTYFLARFIYLLVRLRLLTRHNRVSRQQGIRMVEIGDEIAPFSFFRFLFVNSRIFRDSELHQVLEHEKAHIWQKHSVDHLFAHGFAVFQWFNPLAWQIRKALKTTHEYIADRHVLDSGIERYDYQALLLKQVVGYHSVELVNNFNLKPIKKRIAMMNRNKSGLPARLRAVLVIPVCILVFFLFAEFTLSGAQKDPGIELPELQGLWVNQSDDGFYPVLKIQGEELSTLMGLRGLEVESYALRVNKLGLHLSENHLMPGVYLKYELKGEELTLWWNDTKPSRYLRSQAENTLDHMMLKWDISADLPALSQYRLMDREELLYRISIGKGSGGKAILAFDGKPFKLPELEGLLDETKGGLSKLDHQSITGIFLVDRETPMSLVNDVRDELRRTGTLHFAEGGYPHRDWGTYPLLYHLVALPRVLPPESAKVLDKEEAEKKGVKVCTIDLSARNTSPSEVYNTLTSFIGEHSVNYIISLEYDDEIPYGQYVEVVDMIWRRVYAFRNRLAMEKYNVSYDRLGPELQREIRKAYPMALSEHLKN